MSPRHSWTAVATSIVLHMATLVGAASVAHGTAGGATPRVATPLTFIRVVPAPDPALLTSIEPVELPARVEPPRDEKPIDIPEPPRPEAVVARAEPTPPRSVEAPRPTPEPPRVTPSVGHAIEPPKPVQMAGFDAPAARAAALDLKPAKTTTVGAFSDTAPARPQPGSDRPNVVAEAGFGAAMASPTRVASRQVADAGFGAARSDSASRPAPGAVKTTDFDAAPAPTPAAPVAAAPRVEVPVEIVSKPTPTYTDEARSLKIEGDVVLEVDFTAGGDVRDVRVVRGLGHGLDEAATRAHVRCASSRPRAAAVPSTSEPPSTSCSVWLRGSADAIPTPRFSRSTRWSIASTERSRP